MSRNRKRINYKDQWGVGYDAVFFLNFAVGFLGVILIVTAVFAGLNSRSRGLSIPMLLQGGIVVVAAYVGNLLGQAVLICRDILISLESRLGHTKEKDNNPVDSRFGQEPKPESP